MNKNDLIVSVANDSGLTRQDVARTVEAMFGTITGALKDGVEVRLVGFGTFSVAERAPTLGRNPRTGESISISATKTPKFRAGKTLKQALN